MMESQIIEMEGNAHNNILEKFEQEAVAHKITQETHASSTEKSLDQYNASSTEHGAHASSTEKSLEYNSKFSWDDGSADGYAHHQGYADGDGSADHAHHRGGSSASDGQEENNYHSAEQKGENKNEESVPDVVLPWKQASTPARHQSLNAWLEMRTPTPKRERNVIDETPETARSQLTADYANQDPNNYMFEQNKGKGKGKNNGYNSNWDVPSSRWPEHNNSNNTTPSNNNNNSDPHIIRGTSRWPKNMLSEEAQNRAQILKIMYRPTNQRRPGDWDCPNCGVMCFGSKSKCFLCHTPRPPASMSTNNHGPAPTANNNGTTTAQQGATPNNHNNYNAGQNYNIRTEQKKMVGGAAPGMTPGRNYTTPTNNNDNNNNSPIKKESDFFAVELFTPEASPQDTKNNNLNDATPATNKEGAAPTAAVYPPGLDPESIERYKHQDFQNSKYGKMNYGQGSKYTPNAQVFVPGQQMHHTKNNTTAPAMNNNSAPGYGASRFMPPPNRPPPPMPAAMYNPSNIIAGSNKEYMESLYDALGAALGKPKANNEHVNKANDNAEELLDALSNALLNRKNNIAVAKRKDEIGHNSGLTWAERKQSRGGPVSHYGEINTRNNGNNFSGNNNNKGRDNNNRNSMNNLKNHYNNGYNNNNNQQVWYNNSQAVEEHNKPDNRMQYGLGAAALASANKPAVQTEYAKCFSKNEGASAEVSPGDFFEC